MAILNENYMPFMRMQIFSTYIFICNLCRQASMHNALSFRSLNAVFVCVYVRMRAQLYVHKLFQPQFPWLGFCMVKGKRKYRRPDKPIFAHLLL